MINTQRMKRSLKRLLVHKFTIQDVTASTDAAGGAIYTHSGGTKYNANIQPLNVQARNEYARQELDVTHQVFLEKDPGDVTGRRGQFVDNNGSTRTFTELKIIEPGELDVFWKIICREEEP